MRRLVLLTASTLVLSALAQQASLPAPLKRSFDVLKAAQSLRVEGTVQTGDAPVMPYKLLLAKPNAFRLTTPTGFVVSDGKTVTTYTEATKSYTEVPLTDDGLAEFVRRPEIMPWAAFFQKAPGDEFVSVAAGTPRKNDEFATDAISFEPKRGTGGTLYLDRKLGVVRTASLGPASKPTVVQAKTIKLGTTPEAPSAFAFVAPEGSTKAMDAPVVAFASVKALIDDRCMPCHGGDKPRAGVKLDTYEGVVATVVPGDPKASLLVKSVKGDGVRKMPLGNHPALTPVEIKVWEDWISAGAQKG